MGNGDDVIIFAKGTCDDKFNGNISGGVSSTIEGLDEIKINFDHSSTGNNRITKAILSKREKEIEIHHSIDFTSYVKWSNSLEVNHYYKLVSEMNLQDDTMIIDNIYSYGSD